ncbi:MAG: aspartate-semialdehyde dehydrogenase [Clostridia bacterium]|nr:aspartate-semialdehyde dehydrogenase [Clostridia bacterium]MBQ8269436.1 aspartate-semialdehyde dehydrogenase [Clostridia bacterium]MBR2325244.1 aspartate-semialdehyde dehydrogenase [Clostridia bacterium]
MEKLKVGIVGATGMVGQRFMLLLAEHPYFEIAALVAGPRSAGKSYKEAVAGRWKMKTACPAFLENMTVMSSDDVEGIGKLVDFVFCAVSLSKDETRALEERFAKAEIPVVSNNSANRWTEDVPMVIPEINDAHLAVIEAQRKRLGTKRGFIAVKPNCSIQSYVGALTPLRKYGIREVVATTYQAISGAGKTFAEWEEMVDNVIPFIGGEEEKSEKEPLRVWGEVKDGKIVPAAEPVITTQCIRVPVSDGHMAAVFVKFDNPPSKEQILADWKAFSGKPQALGLPSAPAQFVTYFEEDNRPQTRFDRDLFGGMGVSVGRLREDALYDYKFVGLSHNTLRGAAGGAVLIAELLYREGYLTKK